MDRELKLWFLAAATACGLAAALLLPPQPQEFRSRRGLRQTPERQRARNLQNQISGYNELLKRHRWTDSLSAILAESNERGVLAVGVTPFVSDSTESLLRSVVARELEQITTTGEVPFGLFVLDRNSGSHPDVQSSGYRSGEYISGHTEDNPFCMLIYTAADSAAADRLIVSDLGTRSQRSGHNVLGVCALYRKYGRPGAQIGAWLHSGALRFGRERSRDRILSRLPPAIQEVLTRGPGYLVVNRRSSPFWWWLTQNVDVEACLMGDRDACRRSVVEVRPPTSLRYSGFPGSITRQGRYQNLYAGFSSALFADLGEEFGHEAFATFWKSPQDVESAFEEAFGVPIGEWVMQWAQARLGRWPRGARMKPMTLLLSVLTLAATVGAGTYVVSRQRVVT